MTRKRLQHRLAAALAKIDAEIAGHRDHAIGRGLAGEGYAGGFRDALMAMELLLRDVEPNDPHRFFAVAPSATE